MSEKKKDDTVTVVLTREEAFALSGDVRKCKDPDPETKVSAVTRFLRFRDQGRSKLAAALEGGREK